MTVHPKQAKKAHFFTKGIWQDLTLIIDSYKSDQGRLLPGEPATTTEDVSSQDLQGCIGGVEGDDDNEVTALFINWPRFTPGQLELMQSDWRLPVYDRYSLVVQLFLTRAKSPEARLQARLAELTLLRARSGQSSCHTNTTNQDPITQLINTREQNLLNQLNLLEKQHRLLRVKHKERSSNSTPSVAVVGYTNAGKTSLIHQLTGSSEAKSSSRIFATLDVARYCGRINRPTTSSNQGLSLPAIQLHFYDTVGFMSDLPIGLFAAFRATLAECVDTDLLLHVIDLSCPDWLQRVEYVDRLLADLGIHTKSIAAKHTTDGDQVAGPKVIYVGNKADLAPPNALNDAKQILDAQVSASDGSGFDRLVEQIETNLITHLDWVRRTLRIGQSSSIIPWLYKNASVTDIQVDPEDSQYIILSTLFTRTSWDIFRAKFPLRRT